MSRQILLILLLVVGLCGTVRGGEFAVGTIYDYGTFSTQPQWGIRGFVVIEPNGLYQSGKGAFYHTMTNSSRYGSETLVVYWNDVIHFRSYKWVPANHNFRNNLDTSDTANIGWWGDKTIGSANGTIDPSFQKYVTTLTLDGIQYKAIFFDNVSNWDSVQGKWREVTSLKNFNTGAMEIVFDISWDGTMSENFTNEYNGHNQWAGCFETFTSGSRYSYNNGKKAGNYLMDYLDSSGVWVPFNTPKCRLRSSDYTYEWVCYSGWCIHSGNTGFDCVNTNPVPGFWIATVP